MLRFNFKKKRVATIKAYLHVFNTDEGKLVLQDLMNSCYMNKSTFDENPYEMARMEGERNVALRILSVLGTDENKLVETFKDNSARDEQYYEDDGYDS